MAEILSWVELCPPIPMLKSWLPVPFNGILFVYRIIAYVISHEIVLEWADP